VGGGAMFFTLNPHRAVINDLNPHLINLYRQVRDNTDELIHKVGEVVDIYLELEEEARSAFYYLLRDEFNQRRDTDVWGAALFLFLNKTCYNGVYRENANGKFNVPHGKRKTISFHEQDSIKQAATVLKYAVIQNGSYQETLTNASKGDFVYLDPPYVPLSATSNFTQYIGSDFGIDEHLELRELFIDLDKRGCLLMMSNSATNSVKEFYRDFNQTEVLAERAVNCKSYGRGKITELVITNY
jgi:DNA adenine methylase